MPFMVELVGSGTTMTEVVEAKAKLPRMQRYRTSRGEKVEQSEYVKGSLGKEGIRVRRPRQNQRLVLVFAPPTRRVGVFEDQSDS